MHDTVQTLTCFVAQREETGWHCGGWKNGAVGVEQGLVRLGRLGPIADIFIILSWAGRGRKEWKEERRKVRLVWELR